MSTRTYLSILSMLLALPYLHCDDLGQKPISDCEHLEQLSQKVRINRFPSPGQPVPNQNRPYAVRWVLLGNDVLWFESTTESILAMRKLVREPRPSMTEEEESIDFQNRLKRLADLAETASRELGCN